jgi:hypothetical protein
VTLGRSVGLAVAVVMVAVGALWTGQGLGWVGGSSMTVESQWAVIGPITAGLGVALAITIVGSARQRR